VQIPPLLLQPFVENAIWHGLMHKETGGTIVVDVALKDSTLLQVTVIDDGVGRQKASEFKSKTATKNKSFGMKVTAERIELINHLYKTATEVQIIDLKNINGEATGTKVIIEIPI
jgi:sensor histidine kinase YesM